LFSITGKKQTERESRRIKRNKERNQELLEYRIQMMLAERWPTEEASEGRGTWRLELSGRERNVAIEFCRRDESEKKRR
jgi:hypothetical protein